MRQFNKIHWQAQSEEVYVINLDQSFDPVTSVNKFVLRHKKFSFPGGDPHFQILGTPYPGELIITHRVNNSADFFDIILVNDAARRMGFQKIRLVLPCFPAARQDRVCNAGEPLTVKVFADLVNGCGFDEVVIFTPHSEVTPALLNNVTVLDELEYVKKIINPYKESISEFNIICPDGGAGKRVGNVVHYLANEYPHIGFNLITCEKKRNVVDGTLKGFTVNADDLWGYPGLIVDDINCRGGTFLGLAEVLRSKNCGPLWLFTAHSDLVDGINNVCGKFDHVFTTNSKRDYNEVECENFTCFKFDV